MNRRVLSMLEMWVRTLLGLRHKLPHELPERAPRWARGSYAALRRLEIRVLFVGAAVAFCAWAFAGLADEVEDGPAAIDLWVYDWLHDPAHPALETGPEWLENVVRDFTALGGSAIVLMVVAIVAIGSWATGKGRLSLLVLGACLSGMALGPGLKAVFDRERPGAEYQSVQTSVVYLTLGALVAAGQRRKRAALFALATGIGIAVAVGCSRIALGVHWPTDVIAAWAAGFGWAMTWWLLVDLLRAWKPPAPPAPPDVPAAAA
jgi:undecaprenyl-diphosphatase